MVCGLIGLPHAAHWMRPFSGQAISNRLPGARVRRDWSWDDWFVMADPSIGPVFEGPEVDGIAQSCNHLAGSPEIASTLVGGAAAHTRFRAPAAPICSIGDRGRKLATRRRLEHPFHNSRFVLVDDQLLCLRVRIVAVGHRAGDPPPPDLQWGPSRRNSRRDHLALKLGEGRKDVEDEIILCGTSQFGRGDDLVVHPTSDYQVYGTGIRRGQPTAPELG